MLSQLTLFFLELSFSVWYRSNGCFFHNVNPTPPPPCVAWKGLPEWAEKRRRAKDSGLFFFFEFQAVLLCYDQQGAAFHHGWFMFLSPPPKPHCGACTCVFFKDQILGESGVETLTLSPGQQAALLEKDLHPLGSFVASFEPMGTRTRSVIAPAEGAHQPPLPTTTTTKTTPSQSRSAFVFASSLSTSDFFFLTKRKKMKKKKKNSRKKEEKKSLVDFVLWLAISQVQS